MSVAVGAPQQHGAQEHEAKEHGDGGWAQAGYVPVQSRSERFCSFVHEDFPPVSGLEAEWKLTPVSLVQPLIEGMLDGSSYSYTAEEPPGFSLEWVPRSDARIGLVGIPEERASANAWSNFQQALIITATAQERASLTLTRSNLATTPRAAHTVIIARAQSNSTVILESSGPAALSENVEIILEDGADLTVVSFQDWSGDALHLASHFVTVGRNAHLKHIVISLNGTVVRVNPSVHLSGAGAEAELYGLYFADAGQHFEQRVYLHHLAQNTTGRVNYKGALQGLGARTVWVGDVLIGPDASGTDSYEQNRNLVLTEGTRADSIPNLEIETGNILGAGHASATGRFDDEQLFYLQARGISESDARRLVVIGFLSEIVQKIGHPLLEDRVQKAIESELAYSAPLQQQTTRIGSAT